MFDKSLPITHTSVKPFTCTVCDYVYLSKNSNVNIVYTSDIEKLILYSVLSCIINHMKYLVCVALKHKDNLCAWTTLFSRNGHRWATSKTKILQTQKVRNVLVIWIIFVREWCNSMQIEYDLKGINISYNKNMSVMLVINNLFIMEYKFMYSECGYKCSDCSLLVKTDQNIKSCYIHTGEKLEHIYCFFMYYTGQETNICDILFYKLIIYIFIFIRVWHNSIQSEYGLKGINDYISYNRIKSAKLVVNNFLKTENEFICSECGYQCSLFAKTGLLIHILEHTEEKNQYIFMQCIKACNIHTGEILEPIFWFYLYYTRGEMEYKLYSIKKSYFIHIGELFRFIFYLHFGIHGEEECYIKVNACYFLQMAYKVYMLILIIYKLSIRCHMCGYGSDVNFDFDSQILRLNKQFIIFINVISIFCLLHYRIYKCQAPCCIFFLDIHKNILIPGCPEGFLSILGEQKNCFLELNEITFIESQFMVFYVLINYNVSKNTNLLYSHTVMKLFFISIIKISIKLLVQQMNLILYSSMYLMKMTFDNIWREKLYFIHIYFSKNLFIICMGLNKIYFHLSCFSLISLFNFDIAFQMEECTEKLQYKYILSIYIKKLKWSYAQFILFFIMISICHLVHYKIYKYMTLCCLLDTFIGILMSGCPDMSLILFGKSKNSFLGLLQVSYIVKSMIIVYFSLNNCNMYKKLNPSYSFISNRLFFILFFIIFIIFLEYQMISIYWYNMYILKLIFDYIWVENLFFICFYCVKYLLLACFGLVEIYFHYSFNNLVSYFNFDINFLSLING